MNRDELRALIAEEVRRTMASTDAPASEARVPVAVPSRASSAESQRAAPTPRREFPAPADVAPRWMRAGSQGGLRLARVDEEADAADWGLRDLPPPPQDQALHVPRPVDAARLQR